VTVLTWSEYYSNCKAFARALIAVGFLSRESVAIIGFNSTEWVTANMGAILAHGISAGIYTTNQQDACEYVVTHAGASVVVCEGVNQAAKFLDLARGTPASAAALPTGKKAGRSHMLRACVVWGATEAELQSFLERHGMGTPGAAAAEAGCRFFTWEAFQELGRTGDLQRNAQALPLRMLDATLEARMGDQLPEDVCTLVYTSGTTSMPKAVCITSDNISCIAAGVLDTFAVSEADRMVSYLPLSHIAAAILDIYGPLIVGFCVHFAAPDALKGSLVETLKQVRPSIFFGVPRVFEKMREKMLLVGQRGGCIMQALSRWAKRIGAAASRAEEAGGSRPWGYALANALVFSNVRKALGLDQCRGVFSAAAPMQPETLAYFASLSLPVHEAFGMSETTGPVTANLPKPGWRRTGTCGRAFPGLEMAIFSPPGSGALAKVPRTPLPPGVEGELCLRGRHIMAGYKDDVANTEAAIDEQGWLHTGDLGKVDAAGFLTITGRIKELIKTAGGEGVPPVFIENVVKEEIPAVSYAVLVGDNRKYLVVLLALRCRVDPASQEPTGELDEVALSALRAAGVPKHVTRLTDAMGDMAVKAYINSGIQRANARAISNACRIQKWALTPREFAISTGELTATMKLKRSVIHKLFADVIEDLYAD
jgi:long-chain-fatty-acid--CoA ligase ACSBG